MSQPDCKRVKIDEERANDEPQSCKHFVIRKKRYCKVTPAKGRDYCGEHLPLQPNDDQAKETESNGYQRRIPCPLDSKHTVYARNLRKHLTICNAKPKEDLPEYIVPGLNAGPKEDDDEAELPEFRLSEIDQTELNALIDKVNRLYVENSIEARIEELVLSDDSMTEELNREDYGPETLKHLVQTSSILAYLKHFDLFQENTSYIEFGAGKGQVAFWLAKAIPNLKNSNVLLIDKASLRHKKDNKLKEEESVQRVKADISDFNIQKYDSIQKSQRIVGVSKHLCGAATDLSIRCIMNGNTETLKTHGFVIALCCHHRCSWAPFVGKAFFIQNEFTKRQFAIITKLVSWAICGTGMSRERRKAIEEQTQTDEPEAEANLQMEREKRKEIGRKCKRLLDFGRIHYLEANGYKCFLKYYVKAETTLENVCLVALLNS